LARPLDPGRVGSPGRAATRQGLAVLDNAAHLADVAQGATVAAEMTEFLEGR
jgi:hypothetical protein